MVLQTQALIIVAAYLIGMLLVGFIVGKLKIKDSSDYMLAGRRMGLLWWHSHCQPTISAAVLLQDWRRKPTANGE